MQRDPPKHDARFYARRVQLAGVPIRDDDVRELERLLREGGFVDVARKLDHALTMETRVLALTVVVRLPAPSSCSAKRSKKRCTS